jgi:biopolymer transport protein ExbD
MTLKPFRATLAVMTAAFVAVPTARAEAPHHQTRVAPDAPSLVVRLNADGSVVVSQRDKAEGGVMTLPSIKAFPAEIDALVPRRDDRKTLAVAADATLPYVKFMTVMNDAKKAGFAKIGLLGPEKQPRGDPSELTVRLSDDNRMPDPATRPIFLSLAGDGTVHIVLGMGNDAPVMNVKLAGAPDAAAGLVPTGRPNKKAYFRADFDANFGNALELLRRLRVIGFTNLTIVGEATDDDH